MTAAKPKTKTKTPAPVWSGEAVGRGALVPVDQLRENHENPNEHSPESIRAIAASLAEYGQVKPTVHNSDGVMIAGNGTLQAARSLGWSHIWSTETHLDATQQAGMSIADNESARIARAHPERTAALLQRIRDNGGNVEATGYDTARMDALLESIKDGSGQEETQAIEPIAPPSNPTTKLGDVWVMGDHRLICGDCRNDADVARLLDGSTINVAITSPPYASQRKYDESSGFEPIHPDAYVDWFDAVQAGIAAHIADDGSWFLNIKEHCEDGQRSLYVKDLTLAHVRKWGWRFVDEFIWTHGGTPKAVVKRFKNGWEPIFQFTRNADHKFRPDDVMVPSSDIPDWSGLHPNMEDVQQFGTTEGMRRKGVDARAKKSNPSTSSQQGKTNQTGGYVAKNAIERIRSNAKQLGGSNAQNQDDPTIPNQGIPMDLRGGLAYPSNVLSLGKNREALGHPAAYPIKLPDFFVRAYSDPGDVVYDPFMGSGSTLVAADALGRRCFGVEISPGYCDVIVDRWERSGEGRKAVRA